MTLHEEVRDYVKAAFSGIWVQTSEFEDATQTLVSMCRQNDWAVSVWDTANGLQRVDDQEDSNLLLAAAISAEESQGSQGGRPRIPSAKTTDNPFARKPGALLDAIPQCSAATGRLTTIWILKNFHRPEMMANSVVIQMLQNLLSDAKSKETGSFRLIILSPVLEIPVEIEKQFVVVDYELPDSDELWEIAQGIAEPEDLPKNDADKRLILDAGAGLTRRGFEDAVSLSLIKHDRPDPDVIWNLKSQDLKKSGLLQIYDGHDSFDALGGLDYFKQFSKTLLTARDNPLLRARGLLLLGVPGAGKSAAVKCLGNAVGRKVLFMDMGTMRGKFQGETDRNMRKALKIVDAMEPAILFVDEIEKALSGAGQSSAMTDGGAGDRLFGKLLTWLNDHESDILFVGTCNNISMLPPEFSRAERFDGIFFFDVPTRGEREEIWQIYLKMYSHKVGDKLPKTYLDLSRGWTGAEIRACCRLAAITEQPVEQAAKLVVPIVRTADTKLRELREWAEGRCLSATREGLYTYKTKDVEALDDILNLSAPIGNGTAKKRRRVARPSNN